MKKLLALLLSLSMAATPLFTSFVSAEGEDEDEDYETVESDYVDVDEEEEINEDDYFLTPEDDEDEDEDDTDDEGVYGIEFEEPEIVTFPDVDANAPFYWEIYHMAQQGFVTGDNEGNFRPYDTINRAEFATIFCRAIGVEDEAAQNMGVTRFDDVIENHWASGYINTAVKYGAINGYEDNTFRPDDPVTNAQAIKMLVAGMGHTSEAEDLGGYPVGYAAIAKTYGVVDTLSFNYETQSRRWVTTLITYCALKSLPMLYDLPVPITVQLLEDTTHEQPIPENYGVYMADPVSLLKLVNLADANIERTIIEQIVPAGTELPFDWEGREQVDLFDESVVDTYRMVDGQITRTTYLPEKFNRELEVRDFDVRFYADGNSEGTAIAPFRLLPVEQGNLYSVILQQTRALLENQTVSFEINGADTPFSVSLDGEYLAEDADLVSYSIYELDTPYECKLSRTVVGSTVFVLNGTLTFHKDDDNIYVRFTGSSEVWGS